MSSLNLAVVFAPSLFRSNTEDYQEMMRNSNKGQLIMQILIDNYETIFSENEEKTKVVKHSSVIQEQSIKQKERKVRQLTQRKSEEFGKTASLGIPRRQRAKAIIFNVK